MPSDTSASSFDIDRKLPERRFSPFLQPSSVVGDLLSQESEQIAETNMVIHSVFLLNEVQPRAAVYPLPTNSNVIPDAIGESWQALANSGLSETSYLFLLKLARKDQGWRGFGSLPLSGHSLSQFLNFWQIFRAHALEPEFALMPNGNLQAEWYMDDTHFTELEFKANGSLLFGVFDGASEFEGAASLDELKPLLMARNYRYLSWRIKDRSRQL